MLENTADNKDGCECKCGDECEECLTQVFEDGKMFKVICDCNVAGECACFGYID